MWRMPRASHPWLLLLPLFVQACDQVDQIQNDFRELTPHEAYFESLSAVGLAETPLQSDFPSWKRAFCSRRPPKPEVIVWG